MRKILPFIAALAWLGIDFPVPAYGQPADSGHHHHHHHHAHHGADEDAPSMLEGLSEVEKALTDADPLQRSNALRSSVHLSEAERSKLREKLLAAANDPDPRVRIAAHRAYRYFNFPKETLLPVHLAALNDSEDPVKIQAVIGIGRAAQETQQPIPELLPFLDTQNINLRFRAAEALDRIGEPQSRAAALCVFSDLLTTRVALEPEEQGMFNSGYLAASRLDERGNIEPEKVSAALRGCRSQDTLQTVLHDGLGHSKRNIRAIAAKAIQWHGQISRKMFQAALKKLEAEEHPVIRGLLIAALSAQSEQPKQFGAFLLRSADAQSPQERSAAYRAFGRRPNNEALPVLRKALQDSEPAARIAALEALALQGSSAAPVVPAVIAILDDSSRSDVERGNALVALKEIGTDEAKAAVERFIRRFQEEQKAQSATGAAPTE